MERETGRLPYRDRRSAGAVLAGALSEHVHGEDVLVLGLPRGGVVVAAEVARRLGAALDVLVVRKLGMPGQEELAMGALASGGIVVLNRDVAGYVSEQTVTEVARREQRELERRERAYRGERPPAPVSERRVVLVDDGLATGATMRAAVASVRERGAASIFIAVPVAPPRTVASLREEADDVICPATPDLFLGIGQFYIDFAQTTDEDVRALLGEAWGEGEASQRPS